MHDCQKGDKLIEFLEETNYTLLNDGRYTYDCSSRSNSSKLGTTPDISMGSPALATNTTWDPLTTTLGSDHYPIKIVISTQFYKSNSETMPKWKFDHANWELFSNMCYMQLDPNIPPDPSLSDDVNSLNEQFTSKLQNISSECIPKTSGKLHNRPTNPWWTQECTEAIKHRAACQRRWRSVSNPITKEKYKREYADAKLSTKQVIENAKNEGWKTFISQINHKSSSKDVWDKFNRFRGKKTNPSPPIQNGGQPIHENKEKAEILTTHYSKTSSDSNLDPAFKTHKEQREQSMLHVIENNIQLEDTHNTDEMNRPFILSELGAALSNKKSTAPGADQIHYNIIKKLPVNSKLKLLELYNKSWAEGTLPDSWKEATIIPIIKPNKDATNASSYRPISLTSALCKIMETMIANRLKYHIETKNKIHDTQSGFRNHRSTMDQLARLETTIKTAFMAKQSVVAVFLDLEKAFDLMWTKGVIFQLKSKGITNRMLKWIDNFLSGRNIRVRLGQDHAEYQSVENGCPQGSVLSPLLFNIIIDTLYDELTTKNPELFLSQFADDSTIWHVHKDIKKSLKLIQGGLDTITEWQKRWGFKISPLKTEAVIFSKTKTTYDQQLGTYKHRGKTTTFPQLTVNNTPIPYRDKVKFLGMTLDYRLTWHAHIANLLVRCRKDINLLKLVSATSYGADKKALLLLYKALIMSKIDYGSFIYQSCHITQLDKIEKNTKPGPPHSNRGLP